MSAGCLILYKDGHGAKLQEKSVEITENGNTIVTPNDKFNGLSKVSITTNVSLPPPVYQDKTISILENTQTEITPDSGYDALSKVTVNVSVPEDPWSTSLKTAIIEGHGDWQKDDMLQMFQSDAEVFKTWNTIPAFVGPTYKFYSYNYIPDLPLPNNVANIFSGWKNIRRVPDSMDFTVKPNIGGLFFNCFSLEEIPFNNKELATMSLQGSFKNCYSLFGDIIIKAPNCSLLNAAFSYSLNIESITLETAPVTEFLETFYNCTNLKSIYGFRPSENATYFNSVFVDCSSLENLTFASDAVISNNLVLFYSNSLTVDSIMNVIAVLKDYTGGTARILQLGATNLAKLTDEQKAIATNKNWVLQ